METKGNSPPHQPTTAIADEDILVVFYAFALAGCSTQCINHSAEDISKRALDIAKTAEHSFRTRNASVQTFPVHPNPPTFKVIPVPNGG